MSEPPRRSPARSEASVAPPAFRRAVEEMVAMRPRADLFVTTLDAPPRLAPWSWACSVEADATRPATDDLDEPDTSGRLILLHDPAGKDAWDGVFRLVCFVQARLEPEQLGDEMLPVVSWSWLTEALDNHGADFTALGGTVTQTSSVRFGDRMGDGVPGREDDIELRASWTPGNGLTPHAEAFCSLVASAAGLPPFGSVPLAHRTN